MTIHRMYVENGNRAGFWIQHRTWTNICAQVQSISGQANGELLAKLELDDDVAMRVFDIRSGRESDLAPRFNRAEGKGYCRIAEPYWFHEQEKKRVLIPRARS